MLPRQILGVFGWYQVLTLRFGSLEKVFGMPAKTPLPASGFLASVNVWPSARQRALSGGGRPSVSFWPSLL